ncbi:uncharacterized protein (TIGR02231 family) [Rhodobacter aestuarii]|uniref:DUF4139 domain-containing protein n=1 Tax=Rhodobacter aestuarii TaxID=453582 RepID=A0A1N7MQP9_9RHOB|nr:DUF4139 domain-containing protein [Rhodobacter aestuarii]PTV96604.1 uncharacterized protein (TIGR02231 family) [Rhodobacter aestuarii]SIS88380.1 conserved hypothetical protein [Rhodobacter aestuarii]
MPKLSLISALMLAAAPSALFAAPTEIPATLEAVTLFPWGAQVTRTLTVPEGAREVLVPNLPDHTLPEALRVAGTGVTVGAVTLIDERQPVAEDVTSPELEAAREAFDAAREALATQEDAIAAMKAKVAAAEAQAAFLKGLDTANTPPAQVVELAQAVATGVQAAEEARVAAEAEVRRAEAGLKPAREAVQKAKQALNALQNPATQSDALLMSVAGAGQVTITTYVDAAGWMPSYDIRLESAAGKLVFDRYVSVHQASGEDWTGVTLTLSTARPSEQSQPSELWPDRRRIGPSEPPAMSRQAMGKLADYEEMPMIEAAPAPVADTMQMEMQGETVTYSYAGAVDIRDGVEDLRLKLDQLERPVEVLAEAVPLRDDTAFRVAEGVNGAEPILPGEAVLWLDGAVVGTAEMPFTAAGDKLRLGFGAIDGLKLKRVIPSANEGDRGLISKTNERSERVEIAAENLTDKAWAVRLIDRVPYSEQEDLQITHTATPPETTANWDDKRGLLAWDFDLAPGAVQNITLQTTMRWPADQMLR